MRKEHKNKSFCGMAASLVVVATMLAGMPVRAQAAPSASTQNADEGGEQPEIVVTGYRASVERSIAIKRKAAGIVDAITAEDMGKMPDLNLSESLQRVPGVTIDRNAGGEGRSINLRGLGASFTRVELDGMSGLASGTGGRFGTNQGGRAFNFEILASELFSKAEIYKTATPDQTEGGLAGLVRLETPKPFDNKGFKLTAGGLGNYGQNTGRLDPRLSLLVSQNWNDRFGIAASVAWSKSHFVTDTAEGGSWRAFSNVNTGKRATDAVRAALIANGPRYYHFDESRDTLGITLATQYRPSDNLDISVDGVFAKLTSRSRALRDDMALESGINAPISTTIENGVITAGQFTGAQQRVGDNRYHNDETMGQVIARADWHPGDDWSVRPSIGYAKRKADRTWNLYSFRLADSSGKFDPGIVSYKIRGNFLDFSSTATDFTSGAQNFLFNVFVFRPTADVNDELQTKLDIEKTFDGALKNVKAGIRYADGSKTRTAAQSRLNVNGVANSAVPNLGTVSDLVDYDVRGSTGPSSLLGVNERLISGVYFPNGSPVTGTAMRNYTGYAAQQTYTIGEKTLSGYASTEFDTDGVQVIGGVRFISTRQTSRGFTVANINLATQTITPVSYGKTYTAFLPSLTAKWDVAAGAIVRAAYSRTLTRPDYDSLAPSETVSGIDAGGGTGTKGNPNLNPYLSDNIDFGGEYYFGKDGLIAANVFYKKMDGFIDTTTFVETRTYPRQADGMLVTGPITFTQPINSVSASVKGLELAAQSGLPFLPGMLSNLGVQANLTLTDSSADFATAGDVRSRGLPGLSKRSWNATLYYSTPALDVRFSYAWRSRYLAQFSDDFAIPRFVNAYGQLDFSANYNLNKRVSFQLQALNLTRNQEVDVSSATYLPYGVNQLDRRILFGARMSF